MNAARTTLNLHLEPIMGTVVGFFSPDPLCADGVAAAVDALHEANRIFSTWDPDSPMSLLRSGIITLDDIDSRDADVISEVLGRCRLAREITGGAFDPWALPGGVDPTGLVKGWAAGRALHALGKAGLRNAMVNAGGDIGVIGAPSGLPWRIGVRHPAQPKEFCAAVVEVDCSIATSGNYERPGQLLDPKTGKSVRVAASATVTGPDLDLADALATGLAVGGKPILAAIDRLPEYEAYLIAESGRHYATPGMAFAAREA